MSETVTQASYKFSLLNLIERTATLGEMLEPFAEWYGPESPQHLGFQALYQESKTTINMGLLQVGGLEVVIGPTDDEPAYPMVLLEWGGRDPEEPNKYAWAGIRPVQYMVRPRNLWAGLQVMPPRGEISLDPSVIDEIRQTLLFEEEFNV